jgi:hypothetical protein
MVPIVVEEIHSLVHENYRRRDCDRRAVFFVRAYPQRPPSQARGAERGSVAQPVDSVKMAVDNRDSALVLGIVTLNPRARSSSQRQGRSGGGCRV